MSRLTREINYMEQEWYRCGLMYNGAGRYQGVRPLTSPQRRRISHKENQRLARLAASKIA